MWVKPQMGCGDYWRSSDELMLLGVRGRDDGFRKDIPSWLECGRGRHSAKPEQIGHLIERVSPRPRLDLFGPVRPGAGRGPRLNMKPDARGIDSEALADAIIEIAYGVSDPGLLVRLHGRGLGIEPRDPGKIVRQIGQANLHPSSHAPHPIPSEKTEHVIQRQKGLFQQPAKGEMWWTQPAVELAPPAAEAWWRKALAS